MSKLAPEGYAALLTEIKGRVPLGRAILPVVLLRHRLGEAAFAPIAAAVRQRVSARFGEGPQRMAMIANLAVGTRP